MGINRGKWFVEVIMVSFALILTTSITWAVDKAASEGKVCTVNGTVITQVDVDREMGMLKERLTQQKGGPLSAPELSEIQKKVLENLINLELLFQESKKMGIKVDDAAVEDRIGKWKKQFPSETEFKDALTRFKLSEAGIKDQIKRAMTIQEFIDKKFGPKVSVPDQEIKAYYDSHPETFKVPDQVKASHILIKVDPKATEAQKAEAKKKIEAIQQRLKKGEDFAVLAKEVSQCPSASNGGDLGYFRRGQMVKPFEDAAFTLKPGEVSGIVETGFGYHLIKVIDKKPESTLAYDTVKERLGQMLKEQKIQKETEQYLEELSKNAKIERFLKEADTSKTPAVKVTPAEK